MGYMARPAKPNGAVAGRNPERTRERILSAAMAEFAANGFAGARVDAIAGRAALHHVADVDRVAGELHRLDHLRQQLAGLADERHALLILVGAWRAIRFAEFGRAVAEERAPGVNLLRLEDAVVGPLEERQVRRPLRRATISWSGSS